SVSLCLCGEFVGPEVAVERLGEEGGGGGLAGAFGADEEVSVTDAVLPQGAREDGSGSLLADQHQYRSNRSTSITNATAPPTCTFTGFAMKVPTGVASGGRTFTYCSRVLQLSLMIPRTISTSPSSAP